MRTVFKNGVIYRGRHVEGIDTCTDMVVHDDLIEYLGNDAERRIPELNNKDSHIQIDLQGRSIFPAFLDGHMHLFQFGISLTKTPLDDCENFEDIRQTILQTAKRMPDAPRLLFRGWRQSTTNREALASMLDDLDPRPIYIDADDIHSSWCSSAALKEMGVDRNTPDPPVDGTIHRDKDGNPSGLISEGAVFTIVWPYLASVMSVEERISSLQASMRECNGSGYTGGVDMAMDESTWKLLETMRDDKPLPMRIAAHWLILPTGDEEKNLAQVQTAIDLHAKYNRLSSPDFRIAGIKLICDGVVDSCTAAVSTPYLVAPNGTGQLNWTQETLPSVIAKADQAGLQVACHAIGDAAINLAIDTLEKFGTKGRRHRIEHLELTHPNDAKRLGMLGITASMQPGHSDPEILGAWPELIGEERCSWAFPHREFHDSGTQLAFGTDAPTGPYQPLPNLYVANTRKSARNPHNHSKINHRPGLDMQDVINAATWGAAYSCFAEDTIGSLEIGKKADFVVLEGLSSHLEAKSLLHGRVAETWMNGRKLFS